MISRRFGLGCPKTRRCLLLSFFLRFSLFHDELVSYFRIAKRKLHHLSKKSLTENEKNMNFKLNASVVFQTMVISFLFLSATLQASPEASEPEVKVINGDSLGISIVPPADARACLSGIHHALHQDKAKAAVRHAQK